MENYTEGNDFILNAFSDGGKGLNDLNSLIITLTRVIQPSTPMYFLLSNLSLLDFCYSSTTVPKMLKSFLNKPSTITLPACIVQMFMFLTMATSESLLLAVMAYDRYVAICIPLRYVSIMSREVCLQLTSGILLLGCINGAIHTINTFRLPFCGLRILNHFFCDIPPLLKISCIDTYFNEVAVFGLGGVVMFSCFLLICGSYIHILFSVLKLQNGNSRKKALSTCISHLVAVLLFYVSGSLMYLRPKSNLITDKEWVLSIFYTCITPLLNPLIYSLRNKDIQRALTKLLKINH
ncbi:hypothetical protein GDO86_001683 [Hymenochirus boettgeri]|uniref:Olfactory receptor n=1 Tax=Hymenochirus boettgeri TaxID=247094 RepID=A0A8T2KJK3_9PIPI|nr:hypothetical protein GDO86_001683 [Hymenochirus boettgeri]